MESVEAEVTEEDKENFRKVKIRLTCSRLFKNKFQGHGRAFQQNGQGQQWKFRTKGSHSVHEGSL